MWRGELPARAAASPGLLRRRYSVPETIMRKYRLAQQKSDMEEVDKGNMSPATTSGRGNCSCCGHSSRRDRDPMRKSALLRLWGKASASPVRSCGCQPGTRSLDASHTELRSPRCLTPKRIRLDSFRENEKSAFKSLKPSSISNSPIELTNSMTFERNASPTYSEQTALLTKDPSDYRTDLQPENSTYAISDDYSFTDSSDNMSKSMQTTKEIYLQPSCCSPSPSDHFDGHISETSTRTENKDSNMVPYDQPMIIDNQKYDILEIVVSETLNVQTSETIKDSSRDVSTNALKNTALKNKNIKLIDIDEFVSNILVESLNSLTDQLESMNASMGTDNKLNIVEKEIKVKLQNTGVNTIVHLSPTSNNQIIFGNEELCNKEDGNTINYNIPRQTSSSNIRESALSLETNNNLTSAESLKEGNTNQSHLPNLKCDMNILNVTNNDNINQSILHQIQKLFKEEYHKYEPVDTPSVSGLPGVSHVEISNVDVFLNDNSRDYSKSDTIEIRTQNNNLNDNSEAFGGVGTGNYYDEIEENTLVPRFSALPHSDSMEVNTSSSDDTDILGSECTSLVDSLDDPNSPRSILLRRAYTNSKRCELVRSSIDVLDLLPENICKSKTPSPKEKGEAFFIRIKDNNFDCEKENIVVADHMPETIKQRLYRRHRKREQRMECARNSKVKQIRKEVSNKRYTDNSKSKKEIEKECMAIINTLIEDVIAKIAQDEYKYMRLRERSIKLPACKSDKNLITRSWKQINENKNKQNKKMIHTHSCYDYSDNEKLKRIKHSDRRRSPTPQEEQRSKRIYQKSEIHDGNNCIEILEIIEYVNHSQSSTDTTNSDENHNGNHMKNKKSRIPIPVHERIKSLPKTYSQKASKTNNMRTPPLAKVRERNDTKNHLLASMLLNAFDENEASEDLTVRRTVAPYDARTRSNSLRFQNSFDIIPEEKSSLSMESTGEDIAFRRASAPSLGDSLSSEQQEQPHIAQSTTKINRYKDLRSTGTSPMPVAAMTSPIRKSTATSPIRLGVTDNKQQSVGRTRPLRPRDDEGNQRRKSVTTQYEEQLKVIQSDPEIRRERKIKIHNCLTKDDNFNDVHKERRKKTERNRNKINHNTFETRKIIAGGHDKNRKAQRTDVASGESLEGSSSSSESGGSLLCALAPAWLGARRRRRRAHTAGDWAVTVAGSCAAALPNDVEMRLRFPEHPGRALRAARPARTSRDDPQALPPCTSAVECGTDTSRASRGRRRPINDSGKLTLTLKKEASDSAVLASKSVKNSSDLLPDLETFRASRSKTKSSVKTRRGCSLHCWLPEDDPSRARPRNGLSVLGSSIVPERKPRAPTMSERDLTGLHPPRHPRPRVRP